MSGWIIALIVVAVLFITGAIFCKPISKACNAAGKTQDADRNAPKNTVK